MTFQRDADLRLPPELASPLERWLAEGRLAPIGNRLCYFPTVTSTNTVAASLAGQGAGDGTVVVADQQTAGRGRAGRAWFSPPGAGVYVSVLLRPAASELPSSGWLRWLTLAAGVALAEGLLQSTGLPVAIKWPNDLVVAPAGTVKSARKLAGILAEAHAGSSGGVDAVVLGYGVNVGASVYPPDIGHRATSLEAELGRAVDRGTVLAVTLDAVACWVRRLRDEGGAAVASRWRALGVGVTGATVEWTEASGRCRGVTDGIDEDGALVVRQGEVSSRVMAGEVTWL